MTICRKSALEVTAQQAGMLLASFPSQSHGKYLRADLAGRGNRGDTALRQNQTIYATEVNTVIQWSTTSCLKLRTH